MDPSYVEHNDNFYDDDDASSTIVIIDGDIPSRYTPGYEAPAIVYLAERTTVMGELRTQLWDHEIHIRELEGQVSQLQVQKDKEVAELSSQLRDRDNLVAHLQGQISQPQSQKDKEIEEFKSQLLDRDNSLAHLRDQISDMTPSAEIGVSIRHRFLEKERISIAKQNGQTIGAQGQEIIDKGNSAAHGGNGAVDASLFKRGLLSEEHKQVFRHLYKSDDQDQYLNMPSKLRKALDIQREALNQVLVRIGTLHETLEMQAFERSSEADDLLALADAMKEEIVKSYRQRFNRNR